MPLVAWDKLCMPKNAGGAGLRNLMIMNLSMGEKLVWKLYTNNDQKWVTILRRKYLNSSNPINILKVRDPLEAC